MVMTRETGFLKEDEGEIKGMRKREESRRSRPLRHHDTGS